MIPDDHMPHQRIFNDVDPVSELKKYNTPLIVAGRRRASVKAWENGLRRPPFEYEAVNRQRKPLVGQTAGAVNGVQGRGTQRARKRSSGALKSVSQESVNHAHGRKLLVPSTRRQRAHTGPSEIPGYSGQSQLKSHLNSTGENSGATEKKVVSRRSSNAGNQDKTVCVSSNTKRNANHRTSVGLDRKRSASVPQGKYTMAAIVRARSMAMKWMGGNKKGTGRQKLKPKSVLPTINDTAKYSLCSVNCSPQFAETVKLMEKDVGQNATSQIDRELHTLSLD